MPPTKAPGYLAEILAKFDELPNDAIVPVAAAAALHSVSDETVRRKYDLVRLSAGRVGVRVGTLRAISRGEKPATSA
jgi:hypothetical protein